MRLNALSRWTQFVLLVGIAAISASLLLAQGGRGNPSTASAQSCEDYPIGRCDTAPNNVNLTFRGLTSGCTPTSGSCLEDELFEIKALSSTYCFGFCDKYTWTFGDDGSVRETFGYSVIYHSFLGAGPRTVNLTVSNQMGSFTPSPLTVPMAIGPCTPGATTLCLNNGRFRARAIFSAPNLGINNAPAQVVPLTSDTGYLWFFSSSNVEVVLKVVDGRGFNGAFWVFYGALSNVQYTITIADTSTGAVKTYSNQPGNLASVADTAAFPSSAAQIDLASTTASMELSKSGKDKIANESAQIAGLLTSARAGVGSSNIGNGVTTLAPQVCTANDTTLCLNNGRFQVQAIFSAPTLGIQNAAAHAIPLTSDTGYFWFFSSNNVEIAAKAVDGRAFNNFYWFFYGALSNVEYTITVTDTVTGVVKTYSNPAGKLASVADTAAFTN
jgi:hypothetical protein